MVCSLHSMDDGQCWNSLFEAILRLPIARCCIEIVGVSRRELATANRDFRISWEELQASDIGTKDMRWYQEPLLFISKSFIRSKSKVGRLNKAQCRQGRLSTFVYLRARLAPLFNLSETAMCSKSWDSEGSTSLLIIGSWSEVECSVSIVIS